MVLNGDVKKYHTQLQRKRGEVLATKLKQVITKMETLSIRKVNLVEVKEIRKNHNVSIRKFRHEKTY